MVKLDPAIVNPKVQWDAATVDPPGIPMILNSGPCPPGILINTVDPPGIGPCNGGPSGENTNGTVDPATVNPPGILIHAVDPALQDN